VRGRGKRIDKKPPWYMEEERRGRGHNMQKAHYKKTRTKTDGDGAGGKNEWLVSRKYKRIEGIEKILVLYSTVTTPKSTPSELFSSPRASIMRSSSSTFFLYSWILDMPRHAK
jgi:hypothetical protein